MDHSALHKPNMKMLADSLCNVSSLHYNHDVECSALIERQQFYLKIKHFTITEFKRAICKKIILLSLLFIPNAKIVILMYNMFSLVQNKERHSKCYCFVIDAGVSQPLSDSVIF